MVELFGGLGVLMAAALAAGSLVLAEWNRTRCAWAVFEQTHAARLGRRAASVRRPDLLQISPQQNGIRGHGKCSSIEEEVFLPWLDGAPETLTSVLES